MEADIVPGAPQRHDSHSRNQRRLDAFIARHQIKMSRREELIAKAVSKRARKNAKRVRDAIRSELGQRLAREQSFGEPFTTRGLVDAVLSDSVVPMPTDAQFAEWAMRA